MLNRKVKRRPIVTGECIHVCPMMKQHLLARPMVGDLMLFDLGYLCGLDAIVDRRRVQSGFSIGISGIDSCLVLYQYLQATEIRGRQV